MYQDGRNKMEQTGIQTQAPKKTWFAGALAINRAIWRRFSN